MLLVDLGETFLEHFLLGDAQPGQVHLDFGTAERLVAFEDDVVALRTHLVIVVLETAPGESDSLTEELFAVIQLSDKVYVLFDELVEEGKFADGLLGFGFGLDWCLGGVAEHHGWTDKLSVVSHLKQNILCGLPEPVVLVPYAREELTEE